MTSYVVHYTYSDDRDARNEHRPAHRAFLASLAEEGTVLLSGPLVPTDDGPDAALIVISASSAAEVRELLREDPFQQQGLVDQAVLHEWTPVLGAWLEESG